MLKLPYQMLTGIAALSLFCLIEPAGALTMKQCSEKYKAASEAGAVTGMNWSDFRKAECGTGATMEVKNANAPAKRDAARAAPAEKTKVSEKECSSRYQAAKSAGALGGMTWNAFRSAGCSATVAKRSGSMTPTMGSIFPDGVSKRYSSQSAGRARLLTCRDQYEANKAAGISEPKWTEEGGGYYSECNKRLSQQ
jgi:hypothetical protein